MRLHISFSFFLFRSGGDVGVRMVTGKGCCGCAVMNGFCTWGGELRRWCGTEEREGASKREHDGVMQRAVEEAV